jgi:hypothetical protein
LPFGTQVDLLIDVFADVLSAEATAGIARRWN